MARMLITVAFMAAALGRGWAQEGDRGKEAPKAQVEKKEGDRKEAPANDGFLTLDQVDTNGDGKVSRAELEAALKKLGGARGREGKGEGDRKPEARKVGDAEKKEGEGRKDAPRPRKEGEKEGDRRPAEKPAEKKDGEKKEGEK